jgi:predicted RNA-binding Zn ribbon-like protein
MAQPTRGSAADLVPAFPDDLCLGFANTRYYRGSDAPTESLNEFGDIVAWCRLAAILPAVRDKALRRWVRERAQDATEAFHSAINLREAIYEIFRAIGAKETAPAGALATLNRALSATPARSSVERTPSGFAWRVAHADVASVPALLAPVIWSACGLLVSPRLQRVRHCANEQCLWLFVDDSKSGTRRWCAMSACGNRAKAHRHYLKTRQGAA